MITVGIMSMQRIQNYGSFLQAYGLKQILEDLGCEVRFVDYRPGKTLLAADGGTGLVRKISKVLDVLRQDGPIQERIRFIKYKKNYALNYYPYLGITEERCYSPIVDVLVIGSDEVFNCVQNNTNVGFSPDLFGQGNNAGKLISYAASFGNTTVEMLDRYLIRDRVAQWLKGFDAISVRDRNSGEIVKALTGIEPRYDLDPVLIYDFIGKCRDIPRSIPENDFMLLYGYSGRFTREECREIRRFADKRGLKIFCIGGVQDCCDRFIDVDPFTVIAFFQHADCVVTDTFHGIILSVIAHRQFAAVVRESGYGNSQKVTDLLDRLGLNNRRLISLVELESMMAEPIKYQDVDRIVDGYREHAFRYFEEEITHMCDGSK